MGASTRHVVTNSYSAISPSSTVMRTSCRGGSVHARELRDERSRIRRPPEEVADHVARRSFKTEPEEPLARDLVPARIGRRQELGEASAKVGGKDGTDGVVRHIARIRGELAAD